MRVVSWSLLALLVVGVTACAVIGDFASDDPGLRAAPGTFDGRILAVSDADMAATAYADGRLEPVPQDDALTLLADGRAVAAVPASNSVISWPQVVDVAADGRLAMVVETRGPAQTGVERYDSVYTDFPEGARIGVYAIEGETLRLVDSRDDLGRNPGSVEFARAGDFAVVANDVDGAELLVIEVAADGRIGTVRSLSLNLPFRADDTDRRARTLHLSPDGRTLAANVANRRIQFYRLAPDDDGLPLDVQPLGRPTEDLGSRLAVGKWTPDGRHFVVTDTNWDDGTLHMLTQGPGTLIAIRPPQEAGAVPTIVSRAEVGRSPEGFGISPDGTRLATINMERTYLPEMPLLAYWQGRRRYSVSLLSLEPETGALEELDRIYQAGILPEDVIFDRSGEHLAVAVYQRRAGQGRQRGFIDFFSIRGGDTLVSQGVTQPVTRGAHDVVLVGD